MASEGGGKVRSKQEHVSPKPYEREKSLLWRLTDSIKGVLRPSWLADDATSDSTTPQQGVKPSTRTSANFEESQQSDARTVTMNHSQASDVSTENSPRLPGQLSTSVTSNNSSSLWSVSPDRNNCRQKTALSGDRHGHNQVTTASSLWSSNTSDSVGHCSYQKSKADSRAVLQSWNGASAAASPSGFSTSSILSPHRSSLSASRSFNSSLSERRHMGQGAQLADTPLKRQKVWTPEPSRKGRPLQHTPHIQPAFKPAVFCSGQQQSGRGMSTSGRRTSGHAHLSKSQTLNNSWSYQGSPSARATVTPKIVNSPRSAVLSSSTTKIFKTLERLSDTKRMRVSGSDSQSLLSLTPTSYRKRPRPLHSVASPSVKIPSSIESTMRSAPVVSTPSTVLPAPPLAAPPITVPEEKEEDIVVLDDVSDDDGDDDDDIQIVEAEDPMVKCSSPATKSTMSSPYKTDVKNTGLFEKYQPQMDRKVSSPVTQTQSVVSRQSPAGSASPFSTAAFTPAAWGSTAPKPKSIVTGVGKSDSSGNKSMINTDSKTAGSPVKAITELKQGSVMDVLGKSPTTSSPLKSGTPLKQGAQGDKVPASGGDSLFAKFAAPRGSWECDACMVRNQADVTLCVACGSSKPGAVDAGSSSTKAPTGGLAFSSLISIPSSIASPFLAQSTNNQSSFGDFKFGSSAAAAGSFTLPSQGKHSPGIEGFKFGVSSGTGGIKSTSEEKQLPETGGFKFGTSLSSAGTGGITLTSKGKDSSTAGGFSFGLSSSPAGAVSNKLSSTPSEGNDSSTTGGFKIGPSPTTSSFNVFTGGLKQGTSTSETGSANFTFGMTNPMSSNKVSDSGFKFGSNSNELGAASANTKSAAPFTSSETSLQSAGKSVFSNTDNAGFVFGNASSASVSNNTSLQVSNSSSRSTMFQAPPVQCQSSNSTTSSEQTDKSDKKDSISAFNANKTNNSEHAASLFTAGNATSLTSGNFQFGKDTKGQTSSPSPLESNTTFNNASSGTGQTKDTDTKSQVSASGFKFGVESKTGQTLPSQTVSVSKAGVNLFASSSSDPKGFVFGAPSFGNVSSSQSSSFPNSSSLFSNSASSLSKPAVNGESHSFGGKPAPGGFSFGTSSSKPTNDGFSKCSSPSDNGSNSPVPSQQKGFTFGSESNAASSTDRPPAQVSVFGAGPGATSTPPFSFSERTGPQGNAAAASPLAAQVSAPNQGFKFSEAKTPAFSFGTGSGSSTSQFQFASPKSVTTSSQGNGSSGFTFGQTASTPATDNSVPAPTFAAPASLAFAPAPENKAFNMGAGDGPRQVRKAVRRIPRK